MRSQVPGAAGWLRLDRRWATAAAVGLIVAAAVAVYWNSFGGVYMFDDRQAIDDNPTIRHLWRLDQIFSPPCNGETVSGRPLLNLSFALNYAVSGTAIWSYHAVNLAIHVVNALLLLGILRRTFQMPCLRQTFGDAALPLALAASLLWTVHPLQTESVTYVVQRAESLGAFYYLLTLYLVIRGSDSRRALAWHAGAVLSCLLGMGTKEIMVTAPVVVLLYDRTFLAGSFREALRRRWVLYLGLAATWALLVCLVLSTGLIRRNADIGVPGPWPYARTQPGVILHYLRLTFWPHPLCLDYGWPVAKTLGEILPGAVVVGLLLAATAWGFLRCEAWAFLGVWFFLILAPTSSVLPLGDAAFEHRMYLPLAAVATGLVAGSYALGRAAVRRGLLSAPTANAVGISLLAAATAALGLRAILRNQQYADESRMWENALATAPNNARGHNNFGALLFHRGSLAEGVAHMRRAIALCDTYAEAYSNLGLSLSRMGQHAEAMTLCRKAVELNPYFASGHNNLGAAFHAQGRFEEAVSEYRRALDLAPNFGLACNNIGNALFCQKRFEEAMRYYRRAVEINPQYAEAHSSMGDVCRELGKPDEAIPHFRKAIEVDPRYIEAYDRLAEILRRQGKTAEAMEQWREALRLQPDSTSVLNQMAWVLATSPNASFRNGAEAVVLARRAVQLTGGQGIGPLDTLAAAYAEIGRLHEAAETAERARQLAVSQGKTRLADVIAGRLAQYQSGRPIRDVQPISLGDGR